jgi:ABC-type Fe3+/spermidine/putrescine transport system ATPase subunit
MQGASKATIQAAVKRMLDLIGLPGIEKRKPAHLSGGEQQRVALARALVTQPRLLLLDEPLSSLDTAVRANLQEAIRRIQRELGITTLLVTHDLSEAMSMSDRMALLLDGQVAAFDQPMRLFQRPPSEQAARFVGINTFLRGQVADGCLRTDLGTLAVCPKSSKPGPGLFAIRPEHIRIETKLGPNALPGVVTDCTYHGEYLEYQVALPEMRVGARVPMPAEMVPHGAPVQVVFPQEHLFQIHRG